MLKLGQINCLTFVIVSECVNGLTADGTRQSDFLIQGTFCFCIRNLIVSHITNRHEYGHTFPVVQPIKCHDL
jgi:hypothetical protein